MLALQILFTLTSFSCCQCYSYNRAYDASMKYDLAKVINSYVRPLKQLTANFPNHEVELQIEILGTQQPHIRNGRRKILPHFITPLNLRYGDLAKKSSLSTTSHAPAVTTTPVTTPKATSTLTASTFALVTQGAPVATTSTKQTVYMDDLEKALKDLENRLKANAKNKSAIHNDSSEPSPQIVISNPDLVTGGSQNIDGIVELLKKGVDIQRNVPRPQDENLEWFQIKIPKVL